MATAANVTYTFTVGTAAIAAQVNQNFTDLVTWLNTNAVHLDGSKVFTNIPSGPASDPTTDNQFARKAYVDKKVTTCTSSTRPASPATGQIIFETDKNRVRVYNGTSWLLISGSQGASLSNVGQVVANGASDLITFSTENYDTDGFFTGATSTSTITIPEAGTYSVTLRLTNTGGKDFVQGLGSYARLNAPGSNSYYFPPSTHLYDQISETYVIPFAAADTFNITFVCRCGTASVTFDANLVVRRIGD